jgi:predicted ATPase
MADPRDALQKKFANNRYSNFGNCINKITVNGVRGHTTTSVEIRSPITAFSGFNGTGKSTLLQLAAAAYKADSSHFFISDFIVRGPLDRSPYTENASVQFGFETEKSPDGKGLVSPGAVTISYNAKEKRWDGYDRRPIRQVFFAGVGVFLPRSERKDYYFKNGDRLKISSSAAISTEIRDWAARILKCGYDELSANEVKFRTFKDNVISAKSGSNSYSESHMGCGEGKIQCLLKNLEALPSKSLLLLEEPETSLHPNAEYELGRYLIDLATRKGHQILITTHSEMLLRSLPQFSLIYLHRKEGVIHSLAGISSSQASSLMAEGYNKALTILVEDQAAKHIVKEILRNRQEEFLRTVEVAIAGETTKEGKILNSGKDAIRRVMSSLKDAGLRIAAVLDGDEKLEKEDAGRFVFKLPGNTPPETALFECTQVREYLSKTYTILNLQSLESELKSRDCHDYFKEIGHKVDVELPVLLCEAARVYAANANPSEVDLLVNQLKDAAAKQ